MSARFLSSDNFEVRNAATLSSQLLLAEYFHRSANDFAVACAEVRIAGREPSPEQTRDRLATVCRRLYALASMQRLLQPPRDATMDLGAKLGSLCELATQARFAAQGVHVRVRIDDVIIDSQRGWALLMIVSELLTNAARHAFTGSGGHVAIDITRSEMEIVCLVTDDGVGLAREAIVRESGSTIVAELARSAGIELRSHLCRKGTALELRMPVAS